MALEASADAWASGLTLSLWPPLYFNCGTGLGEVRRWSLPQVPPARLYGVVVYLLSFDTRRVRNIDEVLQVELTLRVIAPPANPDGMGITVDAFPWGTACGAEDYDGGNQPGADGSLDYLPAEGEVTFTCRPASIVPGGFTQYRMALSGGEPIGDNLVTFQHLPGGSWSPRLEMLLGNRKQLHQMKVAQ